MPELLTPSLVKSLAAKKSRYIVTDIQVPGLAVTVYPSGSKTFTYRYKIKKSTVVNSIPLGSTKKLTLSDARDAAKVKAGEIAKGIDLQKEQKKIAENKKKAKLNKELRLFNYIDKYYEPLIRDKNTTAEEVINILKKNFDFIKNKRIDKIDNLDIEKWRKIREKDNIAFSTFKNIYAYLKSCINTALKHYKFINSFELQYHSLELKKTDTINPPKLRFLSRKEEKNLKNALNSRDIKLRESRKNYIKWHSIRKSSKKIPDPISDDQYPDYINPIVTIAYKTGFDKGDILDFFWEKHIDLENRKISKIRNKTARRIKNPQPVVVPMSDDVFKILSKWGEQHGMKGRVFVSKKTKDRIDNIDKAWENILDDAGIKNFRFKDLRHTFASWLAIDDTDLMVIRDLMGHTDIRTTQIYAHLRPSSQKNAVLSTFS